MYDKIKFLRDNYPSLVSTMEASDHNADGHYNSYHIEGSVWTHTMMVCSYVRNQPDALQWAALLHDIGKPEARFITDKGRVSFYGHAAIGAFKALDILAKTAVPEEDIKLIFRLIAQHQDLYTLPEYFIPRGIPYLRDLYILSQADSSGAIQTSALENTYPEAVLAKEDNPEFPTMTILVGVPYSGKSSSIASGTSVLSRDAILQQAAPIGYSYTEAWKYVTDNNLQKSIDDTLYRQAVQLVKENKDFTIDLTNMSKRSRKRWISLARNYNHRAKLFIATSEVIADRRVARIGKTVDDTVIKQMQKRFVYPSYEEFNHIDVIYSTI